MKQKAFMEKTCILPDEPLRDLLGYGLDDVLAIPGGENSASPPFRTAKKDARLR